MSTRGIEEKARQFRGSGRAMPKARSKDWNHQHTKASGEGGKHRRHGHNRGQRQIVSSSEE